MKKKKTKPTLGDSESVDPKSLTWSWASVVLQNFTGIRYLAGTIFYTYAWFLRILDSPFHYSKFQLFGEKFRKGFIQQLIIVYPFVLASRNTKVNNMGMVHLSLNIYCLFCICSHIFDLNSDELAFFKSLYL